MTSSTLFIPRSCKEWGLPKNHKGELFVLTLDGGKDVFWNYDSNNPVHVNDLKCSYEFWLEQIELPSDDLIDEQFPLSTPHGFFNIDNFKTRFGAKWLKQLIFKK